MPSISQRCRLSAWGRAIAWMVLALAPLGAAPERGEAARGPRKMAVVLYSLPQDVPGLRELSTAITEGLQKESPVPLDVYSEYTGLDRFASPTYDASLLTLYNEKYAARKVDLLVVVGPTALEFVLSRKFLPGTPVVTCYIAKRFVEAARLRRADLTGALPANNAPPTLDLMLALYPAPAASRWCSAPATTNGTRPRWVASSSVPSPGGWRWST